MTDKLSARQIQILDYIVWHTDEHGYPPTVREIGESVGLSSSSTVHGHLRALEQAGRIQREAVLTRAIRVVPACPGREDGRQATSPKASTAQSRVLHLPLVGSVAAGGPTLAAEEIEDILPVPEDFLAGAEGFMLRVKGDSMIDDGIKNGDFVIVRRQSIAEDGDTVVAMVGDEATVKRFYKESASIRLQPANQSMRPIFYNKIEIVGKVVGLLRRMA